MYKTAREIMKDAGKEAAELEKQIKELQGRIFRLSTEIIACWDDLRYNDEMFREVMTACADLNKYKSIEELANTIIDICKRRYGNMGTNYYLRTDFCGCCGHPKTEIHLGKSSGGWKFLFHKHKFAKNAEEMKDLTKTGVIYNEYDELVSYIEFWDVVETKQKEPFRNKEEYRIMGLENIDGYEFVECEFS